MARKPKTQPSDALPLKENFTGQGLILSTLALLSLGVVMVHSAVASVAHPGPWYLRVDIRHTVYAALALGVLLTAWLFDYRRLARSERYFPPLAGLLLGGAIFLTLLVHTPLGHGVNGIRRWIRIGPPRYALQFQPSEILKLALVIFLSAWLGRRRVNVRSFKTFLVALLLIGVCAGVVIKADFGTAILIVTSALVTLLLAGVPWYRLAGLIPLGMAGFYFVIMHSHRRLLRMEALINPWSQTNPSAYQPRQSLLAIVSGGWFGKGIGGGMQKLGFLPEDSTDFIFAVFCEEWGFFGSMLLMGLVVVWMWHARRAALKAGDRFGQILAGSLGFLLAMQMVLHIAVDLVAAPPTGMSLPFVSAGGTALIIMAGAVALMVSVTAHSRVPGQELLSASLDEDPSAVASDLAARPA